MQKGVQSAHFFKLKTCNALSQIKAEHNAALARKIRWKKHAIRQI